jgi:glutamyl-tRNA(Gln) amidotransferase subunit E
MDEVKIGIEIHQRLDTGKLFCRCKTGEEETLDLPFFYRELRALTSETGELDIAALLQQEKGQGFYYFKSKGHSCLVELDEEPPNAINENALLCALNVANQLSMEIPDAIIFMRKIIIDGSNTSGFQRTALAGIEGKIKVMGTNKEIGIQTLSLEEESAGIISQNQFNLSRLGIPLLEISTKPDISNGKEAREVAETIGIMLRTLSYTARGIGTIRQDLNVSVKGGARVELKGAQELNMIEKWINNEIKRQKDLINLLNDLKNLNIENLRYKQEVDVKSLFLAHKDELVSFLKNAVNESYVYALKLDGHKGILSREIGLRRYGSEIADYARAAGLGGIIHSDENLEKYGISKSLEKDIREMLNCKDQDAFIICAGNKEKVKKAFDFIRRRASMNKVPEETRKVMPDGSSVFLRPLPGKARMYPETDVPYIFITKELVKKAIDIAEPYYKKLERLEKMLNKELAYKILKGRNLQLFESLCNEINPVVLAVTLEDTLIKIRRENNIEPKEESIKRALMLYKNDKITKKAIEKAILMFEKGYDEEQILKEIGKISKEELIKIVKELKDKEKIIKHYNLRIDIEELNEIMKNL